MKNKLLKKISLVNDNKKRNNFVRSEIFSSSYKIINQSKYSNNLSYFFIKKKTLRCEFTRFKNHCLISGYSRAVNSKYKLSRIALSRRILGGSIPGVYRSVW